MSMQVPTPSIPTEAQGEKSAPSPNEKGESWLVRTVAIVSLCGITLSLFGYGVALAAESQFGIPHTMVFTSPFELLELSVFGIAQLIVGPGNGLKRIDTYWMLLATGLPLFLMAVALWSLLVLAEKSGWRERFGGQTAGLVAKLLRKPDFGAESYSRLMARGLVYAPLYALAGPLTVLVGMILVAALCVVLVFIPFVGMTAGDAYIRDWVIGPTKCRPLNNNATRLATKDNEPGDRTDKFAQLAVHTHH